MSFIKKNSFILVMKTTSPLCKVWGLLCYVASTFWVRNCK